VLFILRLDLLPSQRCATLASDSSQRDDVAFTQTGDRAVDGSRGCVPHANVVRDLVGDARSGRHAHQPQILLHLLIVHDFQEGGLFKLEGEPPAERAVENRIASGVGEVGEHEHVFVRERFGLRALFPKEDPASGQNEHGSGSDATPNERTALSARNSRAQARVQSLQISA